MIIICSKSFSNYLWHECGGFDQRKNHLFVKLMDTQSFKDTKIVPYIHYGSRGVHYTMKSVTNDDELFERLKEKVDKYKRFSIYDTDGYKIEKQDIYDIFRNKRRSPSSSNTSRRHFASVPALITGSSSVNNATEMQPTETLSTGDESGQENTDFVSINNSPKSAYQGNNNHNKAYHQNNPNNQNNQGLHYQKSAKNDAGPDSCNDNINGCDNDSFYLETDQQKEYLSKEVQGNGNNVSSHIQTIGNNMNMNMYDSNHMNEGGHCGGRESHDPDCLLNRQNTENNNRSFNNYDNNNYQQNGRGVGYNGNNPRGGYYHSRGRRNCGSFTKRQDVGNGGRGSGGDGECDAFTNNGMNEIEDTCNVGGGNAEKNENYQRGGGGCNHDHQPNGINNYGQDFDHLSANKNDSTYTQQRGYDANNQNDQSNPNNQGPHYRQGESNNNNIDNVYGGIDEQKPHSTVAKMQENGRNNASYNTQTNDNNNDMNMYKSNNMNEGTHFGGRESHPHDPDCLLFISGFPLDISDASKMLNAIEREYNIKFANRKPAILRQKSHFSCISPIPVATPEMADQLINVRQLDLSSYPELSLTCRKFCSNQNRGNNNDNQNGGYYNHGAGGRGRAECDSFTNRKYDNRNGGRGGDGGYQSFTNNEDGGNYGGGGYERNKIYERAHHKVSLQFANDNHIDIDGKETNPSNYQNYDCNTNDAMRCNNTYRDDGYINYRDNPNIQNNQDPHHKPSGNNPNRGNNNLTFNNYDNSECQQRGGGGYNNNGNTQSEDRNKSSGSNLSWLDSTLKPKQSTKTLKRKRTENDMLDNVQTKKKRKMHGIANKNNIAEMISDCEDEEDDDGDAVMTESNKHNKNKDHGKRRSGSHNKHKSKQGLSKLEKQERRRERKMAKDLAKEFIVRAGLKKCQRKEWITKAFKHHACGLGKNYNALYRASYDERNKNKKQKRGKKLPEDPFRSQLFEFGFLCLALERNDENPNKYKIPIIDKDTFTNIGPKGWTLRLNEFGGNREIQYNSMKNWMDGLNRFVDIWICLHCNEKNKKLQSWLNNGCMNCHKKLQWNDF